MILKAPGWFLWFFTVPDWFFMGPGWFSMFFMVPGWFFIILGLFFGFSWFQVGIMDFHGSRSIFHGFEVWVNPSWALRCEVRRWEHPKKSYLLDLYLVPTIPPSGVDDDEEDHLYIMTTSSVSACVSAHHPRTMKNHKIQPRTMENHEI